MVKKIELYEPVANAESIHYLEKNIDDIEGLTVSSSSSARILCQYFSYEMLYNKIVIAIGAVTASTLEDCGIKAEVSQKETLESMIDLLEELI